jgi:hypothetical protein
MSGRGGLDKLEGKKRTRKRPSSSESCIRTVISSPFPVSVSEKKRGEKKKRVHLEEHEIAGVFCSAVLQGDTSSDSTFLSKASPTRELRCIHKREEGVSCGWRRVVKYLTLTD